MAPLDVQLSEDDVVQPDIFVFRHEQEAFIAIAAFPVRQRLSLKSSPHLPGIRIKCKKATFYRREGVEEYWAVDFRQHRILVHTRSGSPSSTIVSVGFLTSLVIPTLSVDLEDQFEPEPPA